MITRTSINFQENGVTLVELLVVIAIASILASLAGPSFTDFINRTRQDSAVSQLVVDLNRARNEAIKRNTAAIICSRASNTTCGNTTNWQVGWLVCVGSGTTCTEALTVHADLPASLSLISTMTSVQFNPFGNSVLGATTFTLGGTWSGANSRQIKVGVTGNISRP